MSVFYINMFSQSQLVKSSACPMGAKKELAEKYRKVFVPAHQPFNWPISLLFIPLTTDSDLAMKNKMYSYILGIFEVYCVYFWIPGDFLHVILF